MSWTHFLGYGILAVYALIAALALFITYFSYGSTRFHPVVTLLASGMMAPAIGLAIIRASRLFGYDSNANDVPTQATLLVCFVYAAWVWYLALRMVIEDRRKTRQSRFRVRNGGVA